MSNDLLLEATDLHKTYQLGKVPVPVLSGASLKVQRGEYLVVRGASGSGKSTLLHLLGGLDAADQGVIQFEGRLVQHASQPDRNRYRNQHVGFIFQFYHLLPELDILENVLVPRMVAQSFWAWKVHARAARKEAEAMLERVGLSHRVRHRPAELSGGERQRVAIARALINHPTLLLADEPTGNLDAVIGGEILQILTEFNAAGQTIVMVTHDPDVAGRADRQVLLEQGRIRTPQS